MALSHKDWELPNSRIWLAETDIDRGLDFPIYTGIQNGNVSKWKSSKLKCKIIDCFHLTMFISVSAKKLMRKKGKEDEQTLEKLNSAHRRSQAKCQLIQTSYIKRFRHIINILLTELSWSARENLDLGRVYRPRSRFSHTDLLLG